MDFDEGILLQATEIERYGVSEDVLDELVLTNKNLICAYEHKASMFSKAESRLEKTPLEKIKVINGKAQIMRINHDDYGDVMQILYVDGRREYLLFWDAKNDIPKWMNAINAAVTGDDTPIIEEPKKKEKKSGLFAKGKNEDKPEVVEKIVEKVVYVERESSDPKEEIHTELDYVAKEKASEQNEKKKNPIGMGAGAFAASLKSVMDTAKQTIDEASKQFVSVSQEQVVGKGMVTEPTVTPESIKTREPGVFFCSNCGEKLNVGAKFCHGCGTKVGQISNEETVQMQPKAASQRTQEYVGTVFKCSNCGSVITQTTAVCPDCGIRITGASALGSVREFKNQLMEIENSRKKVGGGILGVYLPPDKADLQKLTLIRNFPIPNTVDDILEFMMLAIANIDVSLSKNTAMNKWNNTQQIETGATIGRTISNAWVAKMEQVYRKAEISFPNDPAFEGIQRMYFDKMKELKIKIK